MKCVMTKFRTKSATSETHRSCMQLVHSALEEKSLTIGMAGRRTSEQEAF